MGDGEPYIYDGGVISDVDNFEELTGLARRFETVVDKETGIVRTTEEEEVVNIKQQLPEHISEHAASLEIASVDAGDRLVCNETDGF